MGNTTLPVITPDRIISLIKSQKWGYYVDSDGDIGGDWNDNQFHFLISGKHHEVLLIRSMWHTTPDIMDLDQIRRFIDQWHQKLLWPKCYYRISDEGRVRVFTDNAVSYDRIALDQQILQQITRALGTAVDFYDHFSTELGL